MTEVAYLARLEAACGTVSRETFDDLLAFEALFRKWAARINLAAPSTLTDLWNRHVIDSAQLLKLAPGARRWADLGSGGGFPGIVVAILLKHIPGAKVDLIESNRKKAGFLQSVVGSLQLPARVHAMRIEAAIETLAAPEIVTARALASLGDLFALSEPFFESGSRALFHKGRDYRREIEESSDLWSFDLIEHASIVERDSVVLEIAHLRRRLK